MERLSCSHTCHGSMGSVSAILVSSHSFRAGCDRCFACIQMREIWLVFCMVLIEWDHVEDMGEAALRINGAISVNRNTMFFVFVIYTHCVTRFLSAFSRPLSLSVFCSNMSMFYLFPFG